VSGISSVVGAMAGAAHSLALTSDGTVWGWGLNATEQLGFTGLRSSAVPVVVPGVSAGIGLSSGSEAFHGVAVVQPTLEFSPAALGFDTVPVGTPSASRIVTIANNSADTVTINDVSTGGANSAEFLLSKPALPITLSAGSNITVSIQFSPAAAGARSATLVVSDTGFRGGQSISLTGTGDPSADVSVSLAATPDPVKAKSNLTYTITVKNSGPAAAGGVTVTDPLPDGAVFVSASPTQGTCVTPAPNSAGVMNCSVGTLAPGAQAAITLVVNVITTGKQTVSNTASTSYASDSNPANNSATISTNVFGSQH